MEPSRVAIGIDRQFTVESGVSPVPRQPPQSMTLARFIVAFTFALRRIGARSHSSNMPPPRIPWPHAPAHQLSDRATYFVTAGTYLKEHHFGGGARLEVLHRGLLTVARDFGWQLEAWAVFSNHYHFVAKSPCSEPDATSLSQMLGGLHTKTAIWVNRLDRTPGRKVWHNFWETKLTRQVSYLARLNYTHQNAVKHKLVPVVSQYPWCSAAWFERVASVAMVKSIHRFKTERLAVPDEFDPTPEW